MDDGGVAETRTWLAMDLLAPVHELQAIEATLTPGVDPPDEVQALTDGVLGERHPILTEAALAGLLDLERVLVLGVALDMARGLVDPDHLELVESALVDEACRRPLIPLVNAAVDLLLALRRDASEHDVTTSGDTAKADTAGSTTRSGRGVPRRATTRPRRAGCTPTGRGPPGRDPPGRVRRIRE